MPLVAVFNNRIIDTEDIYKSNIDKTSVFVCYTCNGSLHFRQSRNADNSYTEHFYHPNTIKDTHVECESVRIHDITKRNSKRDPWHSMFSSYIKDEFREIVRTKDSTRHVVDVYDSLNNLGLEIQHSPITSEEVVSRESVTDLDWIFDVRNQYIRKVDIGKHVICEIANSRWEYAIKATRGFVYLYTGYDEWIVLEDKESYRIESEGKLVNAWIGVPCKFAEVMDNTALKNALKPEGIAYFNALNLSIPIIPIIYARCKKSMYLLDIIHRDYVKSHVFKKDDIIAVKSVAGSGKTTCLLEIAKANPRKRILYTAFNKSLIDEIALKIRSHRIQNVYPYTFDALLQLLYRGRNNYDPHTEITSVNAQTIGNAVEWFKGKPFKVREYYADTFKEYCKEVECNSIEDFANLKNIKCPNLLVSLWKQTLRNQYVTFEGIRKLAVDNHWMKDVIDKKFDMIMIDETQDFDATMLRMLLTDTTIPKIFVGDPLQSIYQWRGCINGFKYMPLNALILEFYSTFRVGDPACETIRQRFDDCWMISKSTCPTILTTNLSVLDGKQYTYLFRTWRELLTTAKQLKNIWICNYDKQLNKMRSLHQIVKNKDVTNDDYDSDLPKFLKTMTSEEFEEMIETIDANTVPKQKSTVKMYTVHAYKGLEDDYIRIANDRGLDDSFIYYVSLTRGRIAIVEDQAIAASSRSISDCCG